MNLNLTESQLNHFCFIWILIASVTFISLLFVKAPYGKYISTSWGPLLSNKLGWILMEIVSPLVLSFFFWTGSLPKNNISIFIYSLWIFHYCYRSILFPLFTQTTHKKIPLSIVLMAIFFNSINGFTNGYSLGNFPICPSQDFFTTAHFLIGFLLFVIGFIIHVKSDQVLMLLRKSHGPGYHIPQGFLYKWISCPNYFGEVIEWIGFAILCGSLPALGFAIWTLCNLLPRAIANHNWYHVTFLDYPKERKIIIPFIY